MNKVRTYCGWYDSRIFFKKEIKMSEISTIYNYLTKSAGMSVGDAWEIVNTIDTATGQDDEEEHV
jgi:hypothetical protein